MPNTDRHISAAPGARDDQLPAERPPGLGRTVIHLVTNPEESLRRLSRQPPLGWAVAIIVAVSLVYGVDASLRWGAGEQWLAVFPAEPPPGRFALGALVAVPLAFCVLHPLIAGLLRAVAALLGGRGRYRGLLAAYAFALLPSALSPLGQFLGAQAWLGNFFVFWTVSLVIVAVRMNEQLSWGRSFVVVAVPGLIPALVALGVLLLA